MVRPDTSFCAMPQLDAFEGVAVARPRCHPAAAIDEFEYCSRQAARFAAARGSYTFERHRSSADIGGSPGDFSPDDRMMKAGARFLIKRRARQPLGSTRRAWRDFPQYLGLYRQHLAHPYRVHRAESSRGRPDCGCNGYGQPHPGSASGTAPMPAASPAGTRSDEKPHGAAPPARHASSHAHPSGKMLFYPFAQGRGAVACWPDHSEYGRDSPGSREHHSEHSASRRLLRPKVSCRASSPSRCSAAFGGPGRSGAPRALQQMRQGARRDQRRAPESRNVVRHRSATHVEHAADIRFQQLHRAGLTSELHRGDRMHRDAGLWHGSDGPSPSTRPMGSPAAPILARPAFQHGARTPGQAPRRPSPRIPAIRRW